MKLTEAVSKRLLELLKKKNITQYALARKMAVGTTTVYNITHSRTTSISLTTLYLLCDALEMSVVEFLDDPIFKVDKLEY